MNKNTGSPGGVGDGGKGGASTPEVDLNDDGVEMVHVGPSSGDAPLILNSRLSKEFKQHLSNCNTSLYPWTFSNPDWAKKRMRAKPSVCCISPEDMKCIWQEVIDLSKRYRHENFVDLMPINYYLTGLVLQSKMQCIDSYNGEGVSIPWVNNVLSDTKRLMLFQFLCVEEMKEIYIEFKYSSIQEQNQNKESQESGKEKK